MFYLKADTVVVDVFIPNLRCLVSLFGMITRGDFFYSYFLTNDYLVPYPISLGLTDQVVVFNLRSKTWS